MILTEPGLRAIAMLRADGTVIAEAERPPTGPELARQGRRRSRSATPGATLRLTFEVSATLQQDLQDLKQAIDSARTVIADPHRAARRATSNAFLVMIGDRRADRGRRIGIVGVDARHPPHRVARLDRAQGLRRPARRARRAARHATRWRSSASAFNTMLDDLDATRRQVEYLQRIGVWQDVARRLAHEIKNPADADPARGAAVRVRLQGPETDAARFKKLLADTGEIVEEEIAGLRRLVDTFRTLGALPKVDAAPIVLGEVIEELKLDPTMAARLELRRSRDAGHRARRQAAAQARAREPGRERHPRRAGGRHAR